MTGRKHNSLLLTTRALVFIARRYASAVYAVVVRPLSVCLFVTSQYCTNG